ncbi:uncharacterized protein [Dendropsophus ebraccatus]|uniref:uncharacterized protein n=1 Tax=Dendropsophus ebraccatus TaxID=150705 RepID=UPI0038321D8D
MTYWCSVSDTIRVFWPLELPNLERSRKQALPPFCGPDTPLPDDSEFTTCLSCRSKIQNKEEPTIQDVVIWLNDKLDKRPRRSLHSPSVSEKDYRVIDEVNSDLSEDKDDEKETFLFNPDKISRLIRLVLADSQPSDANEVAGTSTKAKTFPMDDFISDLIKSEWNRPEKAPAVSKRFWSLFPVKEEKSSPWINPPNVNRAIAKLSHRTIVPADDGSSLKDPMDRRMEVSLNP